MLQQTLTKHALNAFTDTLLSHFSPQNPYHRELFSNGLKLYRDAHVYNVEATNTTLTGTVQAPHGKAQVTIGLVDFNETTCSCSNTYYCDHIFAVLYSAYASICGIGELLTKWKENTSKPTDKQAVLIKKTRTPTIDNRPENWEHIFQQHYESFQKEVVRPTPFDYYYRLLPKLLECGPTDETLMVIYRLQMSYIVLACMNECLKEVTVSSNFSNQHILNRLSSELKDLVFQLQYADMTTYEPLLTKLLATLETVIEEQEELPIDLYDQYRTLWASIYPLTNLLETTVTGVENEKKRGVRSNWYDYKLAHLYVLQGRDEDAMSTIESHISSPGLLFFWIDFYLKRAQLEGAKKWLQFTHIHFCRLLRSPDTFSKSRFLLGGYLSYYTTYEELATDEEIERIFQDTWPSSITYYEDYLIGKQHYKRWVELIAYLGVDVLYDRKPLLKIVEKEAPQYLLPLYHQNVMAEVGRKNRSSYKQAVRYLKKLRTLYRKEKNLPMWEIYITRLATSTTRLRAFQEELRRSKLIED